MASDRWEWVAAARRYRDRDSGRYLSATTMAALRDDYIARQHAAAATLARDLAAQAVAVQSWETSMRDLVKQTWTTEYAFGRGGRDAMTADDRSRLGAMVRDQYDYLHAFAEDVAAGRLSEAQVAARSGLYLNAATAAQSVGYARAHGDLTLPAHPGDGSTQCVPGDTLVVAPDAELGYRRRYDGSMLLLHTAGGKRLAITPNHPVLTDQGWVAAGFLQQGDNLVCGGFAQTDAGRQHDPGDAPSSISEVFGALQRLGRRRFPGRRMDFHGDGLDGEVDVVGADRFLRDDDQPSIFEPLAEDALAHARPGLALPSQCLSETLAVGRAGSATGGMRAAGVVPSLLDGQRGHAGHHRLGAVALRRAGRGKPLLDRLAADPVRASESPDALSCHEPYGDVGRGDVGARPSGLAGQNHARFTQAMAHDQTIDAHGMTDRADALAGAVTTDKLLAVERYAFHGDVYNLQTARESYIANGIVVHNCHVNCRCRWSIEETAAEWRCTWRLGSGESCPDCTARTTAWAPLVISKE